jgi:hypothetical protein
MNLFNWGKEKSTKQEILNAIHKIIVKNGFQTEQFNSVEKLYTYLMCNNPNYENQAFNFEEINFKIVVDSKNKKLSCLKVFLHTTMVDLTNPNLILDWILIDYLASVEKINRTTLGEILKEFYFLVCQQANSKPNNLVLYILNTLQTGIEDRQTDINLVCSSLMVNMAKRAKQYPTLKEDEFDLNKSIVKKVDRFYTTRYSRLSNVIKIRFVKS